MIGSKGDALQGVELDAAIDYVREHREVWEVILTGGDPLSLSSRRLAGHSRQAGVDRSRGRTSHPFSGPRCGSGLGR